MRRRDQEPRHARAARPDRRGRSVAGEEGRADRDRGRRHGRLRLQDGGRPVRRPDQPVPRSEGRGHRRLDARRRARPREGADGHAAAAPGQGQLRRAGVRRGRHRSRCQAQGRAHRRPADRSRDRRRAAGDRVPRGRDELRDHAAREGGGGEGRDGDPQARRGGPDPAPPPRPADRGGDPLRDEPDARRGRARAGEAAVRSRRRAASAARAVPRDDPLRGAGARSLQEADRAAAASSATVTS